MACLDENNQTNTIHYLDDDILEVWQDVKGYEQFYQISSQGRIRSKDRIYFDSIGRKHTTKARLLKFQIREGYSRIRLVGENCKEWKSVHCIVAQHFIPNPENKPQVNHKDFNRSNNFASNLEWVTRIEDAKHRKINGRYEIVAEKLSGEKSRYAKLNLQEVIEIREKYSGIRGQQSDLARQYHVSTFCISQIVNKKSWRFDGLS